MIIPACLLALATIPGTSQGASAPLRVLGSVAPVEAALKARIERDPTDIQAILDLASLYETVGHDDDAERVLRQALAVAPRRAYEALLAHFRRSRNSARALAVAEEWRLKEPVSPDPLVALAWLHLYQAAGRSEHRRALVDEGLARADEALSLETAYAPAFEVKRQLLALKWILADREERSAIERDQRALDEVFTPPPKKPTAPRRSSAYQWRRSLQMPDGRMPLRVGRPLGEPARTAFVEPQYPVEAIGERQQGTVIVEVLIDEDGRVRDVRGQGRLVLLEGAAIDAIRQWRYEPTTLYGRPVPVLVWVRVEFVLTLKRG